ncbi:MAG: GNAT family N-acetyltransferase [Cyanobacteria bacterium P01_E01_bin.34]
MLNRLDTEGISSKAITIRRRRWGEMSKLKSVFEDATIAHCTRVYTAKQIQVLLQTNNPRRYSSHLTMVAEWDSRIVGYASLWSNSIQAVYVDPYCGRRGIGRKLVSALEHQAKHSINPVLTVTSSLNAEPFYHSCGFHRVKQTVTNYWQFQSVDIPVVLMEKHLGQ